jgi:2'-5' RNA ligase
VLQKYFIAIVPPDPLLSQIQDLKKNIFEQYGTKGALRSPGHITLHMPFSWEEEKEEKLISSLQNFSFDKELQLTLSGFSCFEPRVVFINVQKNDILFEMQQQLVKYAKQNLQLFNQSDDMRGFHPHVTVAFRDLKKPTFYKMWEEYKNKAFDAAFVCNNICLLKHVEDKWEVYKTFTIVK